MQVGEKIGGIGIINFSDPLLELKLPCTLGTTWSDPTGANYTASGTPITRVGTITGIGDAYGTLVLPAGASYSDVLRVHVRRNITNNTILGPVVQIANVYYYYSEALAFPRLKLQQDSVQVNGGAWGVTRKAEWIGENFAVGMDDLTDADVFTAYPNPTADLLNIVRTNSGNAWVEVLDAAGRLVASEPMTTDRLSIPTDALASGVYQVRLRNVQAVLGVQRVVVR